MKKTELSAPSGDPAAVAAYVASLAGELAQLARVSGLPTLAYLLEMAKLEARNTAAAGQEDPAKAERETPA